MRAKYAIFAGGTPTLSLSSNGCRGVFGAFPLFYRRKTRWQGEDESALAKKPMVLAARGAFSATDTT
ncbi:hypothetical protein KCP70_07615 [Salmonella enterica subsp. enterica]|nr:hypothetical protein KCP70_07615 [Salmonella enterica subsp. enterica]